MNVLGIGVDLVEKDESGSHEKNSVSYSWIPGFQI